MAKRRTWLWIVGGLAVSGLLAVVALAAASVYFVSRHVHAETTSSAQAILSFDEVAGAFQSRRPLYELDPMDRPVLTTELSALPSASLPSSLLMVQAWKPEEERLVRLSLPFWLLKFSPDHLRVSGRGGDFDLHGLQLDIAQLERIGPALVLDYRNQDGVRVLLWTK
jgi:hypothetical protein